jgi:prevent-host-death family protein
MYIMYMTKGSANVADLRRQLARVLRLVEHGQEVLVTRHGEGIAMLVPVRGSAELLSASGIQPAQCRGAIPRIRPSGRGLRRSLTRAVLEDRT